MDQQVGISRRGFVKAAGGRGRRAGGILAGGGLRAEGLAVEVARRG